MSGAHEATLTACARPALAFALGAAASASALLLVDHRRRRRPKHEQNDRGSVRLSVRGQGMNKSERALAALQIEAVTPTTIGHSRLTRRDSLDMGDDYGSSGTLGSTKKLVVAMVGLPARGKSYLVKMIRRYLNWVGFPTKIFNVGEARRKLGGAGVTADYFRNDSTARKTREDLAMACQEEMYEWLDAQDSACVAIFDATNTTKARRAALLERAKRAEGVSLIFVESICDDEKILAHNYRMKLANADYSTQDPESALADFMKRVEEYEARYDTIEDDEDDGEVSFIKIINVGEKVITRKCSGYLPSQISFFVGNMHITPRRIWLVRHAESHAQARGVYGASEGDLTARGREFAEKLAGFIQEEQTSAIKILTGNAPVHKETVRPLLKNGQKNFLSTSLLNELCGGDFDGLTVAEFEDKYPGVWGARLADKLRFRYPGAGGESYLDVIARLRPITIELERERGSVLLVAHLAVLRCLYAYFVGTPTDEIPYLDIPAGTVVELSPGPHSTVTKIHKLIDVSTPLT